jgi:hypothetical protein
VVSSSYVYACCFVDPVVVFSAFVLRVIINVDTVFPTQRKVSFLSEFIIENFAYVLFAGPAFGVI